MLHKIMIVAILVCLLVFSRCTKLNETFEGDLTQGQVSGNYSSNTAALLEGVYNSVEFTFVNYLVTFPLDELTTDEAIAPTRGADWDDNGSWRALHQQKWEAGNIHIRDCFKSLNGVVFVATDMLQYHPKPQEEAAARFYRAIGMFWLLDLFGQVPYRDPGEDLNKPARVRNGTDALNYIISEINAVMGDLPDGPVFKPNKDAAKVLLMKCYLNKAVYENRTNHNFDPADMSKVISLADEIINSGKYTFTGNYFDNFAPFNAVNSKENIYTLANPGDLFLSWLIVYHYNQNFGGANGWSTLSDFYNKFEPTDKRREAVYKIRDLPPNPGNRLDVGFLVGQQYDLNTDAPLQDRHDHPLIFTPEVKNIETGDNLEVTGIRPIKYFPNWWDNSIPVADFVFFRFSDVLLMKAEAILRGGTPTSAGPYGNTALSIVNAIRTDSSRGATPLSSVNRDTLLNERGRELWWEGWRRQDLIRFEKFLKPFQEKEYQSDEKYLLFPIPNDQIAVNPNLKQNPGY